MEENNSTKSYKINNVTSYQMQQDELKKDIINFAFFAGISGALSAAAVVATIHYSPAMVTLPYLMFAFAGSTTGLVKAIKGKISLSKDNSQELNIVKAILANEISEKIEKQNVNERNR